MALILSWLSQEGWILLSWWFMVTLAGVAALPLCARLLTALPDTGFILARSVGMLMIGFVFWALAVLGFVRNTPGSIGLAWLIVLVVGWVAYYALPGPRLDVRAWWRENGSAFLIGEVLFIALLVGWAAFRAFNPNLTGTEKPMEMAFISAVQRSATFPPADPWMSGYAISYYHFGYVMAGTLGNLTGTPSPITFNMMIALLFALTGQNTFGVVYNLIRARSTGDSPPKQRVAVPFALLAVVFMIFLGNFQGALIELPYQSGTAPSAYLSFWDVQDRFEPNPNPPSEEQTVNILGAQIREPATWNFWWWFRASRVINDRHLPRENAEGEIVAEPVGANIIDEFPQFSFILADVHPHVLALPFAVLVIGLALALAIRQSPLRVADIVFYAIAVGGLMFLNLWDGPIYVVVLTAAEGLRRLIHNQGRGLSSDDFVMIGLFFVSLVGLAFFFYLPFFISFRSQASGILPNVEFPTLFRQYFVMFGPFILLLVPYLILEARRGAPRMNWRGGVLTALVVLGVLAGLALVLVLAGYSVPAVRATIFSYIEQRGGLGPTLALAATKRLTHSLLTVLLLLVLAVVVARLWPKQSTQGDSAPLNYAPATGFGLLLVACAAGLTLVPEFIYLRDNFGVRINTIFKFYYQAWVMFSIASAYAVYMILAQRTSSVLKGIYAPLLVIVLALGLFYPLMGIYSRGYAEAGRPSNTALTLDGGPSLVSDDDYQAIMCLAERVEGTDAVVTESIGLPYRNQFGRVGYLTGIPIVLGWEGHQRQWRGSTYTAVAGTRAEDVRTLYNTPLWQTAVPIIERYDIDYIFYGTTERFGTGEIDAFDAIGEEKFRENLEPICQYGDSLFYSVPSTPLTIAGAN